LYGRRKVSEMDQSDDDRRKCIIIKVSAEVNEVTVCRFISFSMPVVSYIPSFLSFYNWVAAVADFSLPICDLFNSTQLTFIKHDSLRAELK